MPSIEKRIHIFHINMGVSLCLLYGGESNLLFMLPMKIECLDSRYSQESLSYLYVEKTRIIYSLYEEGVALYLQAPLSYIYIYIYIDIERIEPLLVLQMEKQSPRPLWRDDRLCRLFIWKRSLLVSPALLART